MTSIAQYTTVNCPVGATNIAITTTLLASDLVVLVSGQSAGGGRSVTPSGLGTWNARSSAFAGISTGYVDSLTGVTGTGNVTVTVAGSAAEVSLFVVRGLAVPMVYSVATNSVSGVNVATAQTVCAPQHFAANQALLGVAIASTPSNTYAAPDTASLPSAGAWTVDNTAAGTTYTHIAGHVLTGDGTSDYQLAFTRPTGGTYTYIGFGIVLGEPAANALVLESEYVEAIRVGTPALAVEQTYAEALTVGTPALVLEGSYVDVLSTAVTAAIVEQAYVEVLSVVNLARRGWGILV